MTRENQFRAAGASLLAALSLVLSGCFITPGKFTSELTLSEDESFTFTYDGEIFFLGLSSLAQMGAAAEQFEPEECYDEDTYETRECTEAELTEQQAEWEAGAEERAAKAKKKAEQMSAMLGGVDPNDSEAATELTRLLERHHGWNRVEHKGDGVFDVSYSVSGKITHDFMFPVIEDIPMTNPFVQMVIRDGNVVRINAPGFAAQNDSNPMGAMMGGAGGLAALSGLASLGENGPDADKMPNIPQIEGTFTIVAKGAMDIRANNTDEGAIARDGGKVLTWDITPATKAAPTALIAVGQ